jgi:magnesium-transporting ATPase (P-type)
MSKKLSKGLTLLAGLIGLIGFYFFVRIMMAGDESIENDAAVQASIVSPFISFAKWVLILTALAAVIFSMINLVKHPRVLKRTLLGLAVLAVFLVVSYAMAGDGAVTDGLGKVLPDGEAGSVSKWVSTGINFSAFLGVIGIAFFLVDFAKGLVK